MDLFEHATTRDLAAARAARDAGIKNVTDHNETWMTRYLAFVASLPKGWIGTGEDIRLSCGLEAPGHVNAWGAATNHAVRKGLLAKTGIYVPMRSERSHARGTPQYRRT